MRWWQESHKYDIRNNTAIYRNFKAHSNANFYALSQLISLKTLTFDKLCSNHAVQKPFWFIYLYNSTHKNSRQQFTVWPQAITQVFLRICGTFCAFENFIFCKTNDFNTRMSRAKRFLIFFRFYRRKSMSMLCPHKSSASLLWLKSSARTYVFLNFAFWSDLCFKDDSIIFLQIALYSIQQQGQRVVSVYTSGGIGATWLWM